MDGPLIIQPNYYYPTMAPPPIPPYLIDYQNQIAYNYVPEMNIVSLIKIAF